MKKKLLFFILILFSLKAISQDLECSDFKNGTFIVTTEAPLKVVSKITRRGNNQTEVILEMPKEYEDLGTPDKMLIKLNWIDDCTYIGTFSSAKTKLIDTQQFINDNGGILIKKKK